MGLEKIKKKFDLLGIQIYPISLNPHGLRANRTSCYLGALHCDDSVSCDSGAVVHGNLDPY
jgi:hypothetical protein